MYHDRAVPETLCGEYWLRLLMIYTGMLSPCWYLLTNFNPELLGGHNTSTDIFTPALQPFHADSSSSFCTFSISKWSWNESVSLSNTFSHKKKAWASQSSRGGCCRRARRRSPRFFTCYKFFSPHSRRYSMAVSSVLLNLLSDDGCTLFRTFTEDEVFMKTINYLDFNLALAVLGKTVVGW